MHNSYEIFSRIVKLILRRDSTFGSFATHKKVLVKSILADVVTGSKSLIAAKTKEYKFNLCGYYDVIPYSICTST